MPLLTPAQAEELADLIQVDKDRTYAAFALRYELMGFDPDDHIQYRQAVDEAGRVLRERRANNSALARFYACMLSYREIGDVIDMPRSTVQAMAVGRVPERLTKKQKAALKELIAITIDECKQALDDLG